MKAYYNTRLHQTMERNLKHNAKGSLLSFFSNITLPSLYDLKRFKIGFNTTIFLGIVCFIGAITWGSLILTTYIEYKTLEKFEADKYINEILVPYKAKIQFLEDRISEIEAHSLEVVYFKKFIPTKKFTIKGGTQKQRVKFLKE